MGVYWDNSSRGSHKGGVYEKAKRHNKWRAEIMVNRKMIRLGRFENKEEAIRAYDLAVFKYRGCKDAYKLLPFYSQQ